MIHNHKSLAPLYKLEPLCLNNNSFFTTVPFLLQNYTHCGLLDLDWNRFTGNYTMLDGWNDSCSKIWKLSSLLVLNFCQASGHLPRCSNELQPHIYFFSLELFKSLLLFHVCKEHIWYTFQVTPVLVSTEVLLNFVSWNHLKVIWWERYQKKLRTWYCWNSLIQSELVPWNFEWASI